MNRSDELFWASHKILMLLFEDILHATSAEHQKMIDDVLSDGGRLMCELEIKPRPNCLGIVFNKSNQVALRITFPICSDFEGRSLNVNIERAVASNGASALARAGKQGRRIGFAPYEDAPTEKG